MIHTIAWNSRECDVEIHLELFLPTVIDFQPRLAPDAKVVSELRYSQRSNKHGADERKDRANICADTDIVHCLSAPTYPPKRIKATQWTQQSCSHG